MSPQDRSAMVRGMVQRPAERLKHAAWTWRAGSGWCAPVRSWGDRERALSAVTGARRALGHDTDKLRRLDALVKEFRLEG
jgi:cytochrome c-type biogenesis protein CcmH